MKLSKWISAMLVAGGMSLAAAEAVSQGDSGAWKMTPTLDFRGRYDITSPGVKTPNGDYNGVPKQNYRLRTRAGAIFSNEDSGVEFGLRLVNRSQWQTSSPDAKNNDHTTGDWEFPDELIFDKLYVKLSKLGEEGLSLTAGRQELKLGNGMVLSDGTPYDSSRSAYWDGLTLDWKTDANRLTVFGFYDIWRDPFVLATAVDDSTWGHQRPLRPGDMTTIGAYDTFKTDGPSVDVYAIYNGIDYNKAGAKKGKSLHLGKGLADLDMGTVGSRLFGDFSKAFGYSAELATQFGSVKDHSIDKSYNTRGYLADLRLDWKLGETFEAMKDLKPITRLEYLYLSGDRGSTNRNEGWINVMNEDSGLLGEEASSGLVGNVWSNLGIYHGEFQFTPVDKLDLTLGYSWLEALEKDAAHIGISNGGNGGTHVATVVSAAAKYAFTKKAYAKVVASQFYAGDYYAKGNDGFWGRVELGWAF